MKNKKIKKIRPLGRITTDMEPLLQELVEDHELQAHEILGMIFFYITSHLPLAIERYEDGSIPQFFYGDLDEL